MYLALCCFSLLVFASVSVYDGIVSWKEEQFPSTRFIRMLFLTGLSAAATLILLMYF